MSELEKFLQLEEQLKPYIKMMTQAADTVVVQEVSKYPIFVVHQQEVNIGIPLLDKAYIALAVFVYTVTYLWSEYGSLPDEMPVHYGIDGKPDQMGSKGMMWILVGVGGRIIFILYW